MLATILGRCSSSCINFNILPIFFESNQDSDAMQIKNADLALK